MKIPGGIDRLDAPRRLRVLKTADDVLGAVEERRAPFPGALEFIVVRSIDLYLASPNGVAWWTAEETGETRREHRSTIHIFDVGFGAKSQSVRAGAAIAAPQHALH